MCGFHHPKLKLLAKWGLFVFFRFFSIMFISNCWFELCPGSKTLPQQLQELRSLRCTCIACRNAAETLQITWAVSNPHLPNHVKLTVESEDSPRTSSKCNIICCHWPKGKKAAKSALKASTTLTIPPWDLKKTTQFSITYYYKYIDTWILPSRNHLRKKKKKTKQLSKSKSISFASMSLGLVLNIYAAQDTTVSASRRIPSKQQWTRKMLNSRSIPYTLYTNSYHTSISVEMCRNV